MGWPRALLRVLVLIPCWVLFLPLAISAFAQREGRALPDLAADTVVVPRYWVLDETRPGMAS
jgi:hypothetical protein